MYIVHIKISLHICITIPIVSKYTVRTGSWISSSNINFTFITNDINLVFLF